jgi:DNA-binding transcriptional LysR family regulator
MMTFDQLRIFIKVAETGHLTRAANELNLSQSAVSSSISQLEFKYNLKLFDRIGRNIKINANGQTLLPEAYKILAQVKVADELLKDISGGDYGTIDVVCSQTIGNYWLAKKVYIFRNSFPNIEINTTIANSDKAVEMLEHGIADIGIIEGEHHSTLENKEIKGDSLCFIVPRGLRLWANDVKNKNQLQNMKFVVRENGSGTRHNLEAYLRGYDIALNQHNIALTLPSNEAVLSAVAAGIGVSLISELVTEGIGNERNINIFPSGLEPRKFTILTLKNRTISRALNAFKGILTNP